MDARDRGVPERRPHESLSEVDASVGEPRRPRAQLLLRPRVQLRVHPEERAKPPVHDPHEATGDVERVGRGGERDVLDDLPRGEVDLGQQEVVEASDPDRTAPARDRARPDARRQDRRLEHPVRRGVDRGNGVRRDDDRPAVVAEEERHRGSSEGKSDRGAEEGTPAPRPFHGRFHRGRDRRLLGLSDGGNRERLVLPQDRGLEVPQLLTGLEPELVVQLRTQAAIHLEGVRLPPGAVQGEHQLGVQALLVGVLGDEGLERADELRVPAQVELGVDLLHLHDEP